LSARPGQTSQRHIRSSAAAARLPIDVSPVSHERARTNRRAAALRETLAPLNKTGSRASESANDHEPPLGGAEREREPPSDILSPRCGLFRVGTGARARNG